MNSLKFADYDGCCVAPKHWNPTIDGVCNDLYVKRDERGGITSVWELTPEERARIAEGQNVTLTCLGVQPPVLLTIAPIYEPGRSPYMSKCKRFRTDGPTPCLCCEGECYGDLYELEISDKEKRRKRLKNIAAKALMIAWLTAIGIVAYRLKVAGLLF
jgi:hypothetical protein